MVTIFKETPFMRRPWGWMLRLVHTETFWVKVIHVYPGERTSDQLHRERTEYHIHVPVLWNSRKFLPGERHRMERGFYLEIAHGRPREADIERFGDDYGRV